MGLRHDDNIVLDLLMFLYAWTMTIGVHIAVFNAAIHAFHYVRRLSKALYAAWYDPSSGTVTAEIVTKLDEIEKKLHHAENAATKKSA